MLLLLVTIITITECIGWETRQVYKMGNSGKYSDWFNFFTFLMLPFIIELIHHNRRCSTPPILHLKDPQTVRNKIL